MTYLFAAFSVIWTGLFIYLLTLARRQNKLVEEIQELRKKILQEEKEN